MVKDGTELRFLIIFSSGNIQFNVDTNNSKIFNFFYRVEDESIKEDKSENETHLKISEESEEEIEDKVTAWVRN